MTLPKGKKVIAWGFSKLLEMYLTNNKNVPIESILDSNVALHGRKLAGIEVKSTSELTADSHKDTVVVIFAVSNISIQSILKELNLKGFLLGKNVFLYSDLFFENYSKKVKEILNVETNKKLYEFITSFALTSNVPVHTTFLGNLLFLQLLDQLQKKSITGSIAEVGAFCGGNALIALSYLSQKKDVPYYIFDSFDGFPELSKFDPTTFKKGDYKIDRTYENILDVFSPYPNAVVIKGFVPETFKQLDPNEKYGLVFYDCDLYQPGLDTFDYFWDKIVPGGYLLIHDYVTEEGGFTGVRKAVVEFFGKKKVVVHEFWENTMALIIKE